MSPCSTLNCILIRGKVHGDCVFNTSGHFCQTSEYNEICSLLLRELNKNGGQKGSALGHIIKLKIFYLPPRNPPILQPQG